MSKNLAPPEADAKACPVIKVTASGDSVSSQDGAKPECSSSFLALPQRDSFSKDTRKSHRPALRVQIPSIEAAAAEQIRPIEKLKLLSQIDKSTLFNTKGLKPPSNGNDMISPLTSLSLAAQPQGSSQEIYLQEQCPNRASSCESITSFDITKEKLRQQQQDQISYKTEQSVSISKIQLSKDFVNPDSPDAATLEFPEIGQSNDCSQKSQNYSWRQRLTKILLLPRVEFTINFLVFLDWLVLASVVFRNPEGKLDFGPTFLGYFVVWPYRLRYLLNFLFIIELSAKACAYFIFFPPVRDPPKVNNKSKLRMGSDAGSRRRALVDAKPTVSPKVMFSILGVLDLTAVTAFWINALLIVTLKESYWADWSLLVALSALRPLRLLSVIPQFSSIMRTLYGSLPLLGNLTFFLAYFFLLFGTLGLVLFKGHGRTQCSLDQAIAWPYRYCSGHYESADQTKIKYLEKPRDDYAEPLFSGYICPAPLKCEKTTFKDNEYLTFNTIYFSMLTVYVVSSVEKWTDIMYRIMATVSPWASVFFITCVMTINYWLLTLFVAVIARIFEKLREDKELVKHLASKNSAPAPAVEEGFEFHLVRSSPEAEALSSLPKAESGFGWKRVERGILKALPFLNSVGIVLIAADLLARSQHVGSFAQFPEIYLPINTLLFVESSLQLLKLRHPAVRMARPSTLANVGSKWRAVGTWLHFLFCLASLLLVLFKDLLSDKTINVFSIFPIARFYRLVFAVPRIRALVLALASRFAGIISLLGFILVCILLVAPLSMHLVCLSMKKEEESNDVLAYFSSLPRAMLTLFQIFSGEDWPEVMIEATSVADGLSHPFIIIFFVIWSGFSNFILLNLFVALTMESFELAETLKHRSQVQAYVEGATKACVRKSRNPISFWNPYRYLRPSPSLVSLFRFPKSLTARIPSYLAARLLGDIPHKAKSSEPKHVPLSERDYLNAEFKHSHPMYDTSWFLFRQGNPVRKACQQLTDPNMKGCSLVFNVVVGAAVLVAVMAALINTPQYRLEVMSGPEGRLFLYEIDLTLAAFFLIEFGVRTIADGFLLTPNAYLKHPWYVVEFIVLIIFIVDLGLSHLSLFHFSQVVRGLKAFRALRLMNLVPKVKDTIYGVFIVGFPRILDVSLLMLTLIVPYALYGHLLFPGHGFSCSDSTRASALDCINEFVHPDSGVLMPRAWAEYNDFSFASIGSSMLVLIEILSGEKWVSVMNEVMQFSGEGFSVNGYVNWWYCLYFVLFYVIGTVLVLSMFVAVIIENYRCYTGAARLTSNQRRWIDLRKQLKQTVPSLRPMRAITPMQQWCRRRTTEKEGLWSNILSASHALLLLCLVTEFYGQSWLVSKIKNYTLIPLLCISIADHVMRVLGLGWASFLHSMWVPAHAATAVLALLVTLLSICSSKKFYLYDISNILCLGVTLKLILRSNRLSELAIMAVASLPDILMTLYAWMVLFLTYGILFMQIFGLTRYGEFGSDGANFRSFGVTMLMLFRMTTGESWNDVMHDFSVQGPLCVHMKNNYLHSDCGNPFLALVLFLSFNVLSMFIFANLFVVIVMDNFNYCYDVGASFTLLTRADIRHFKHTWSKFDHHARGYIPSSSLIPFLMSLDSPFAMRYLDPPFRIKALLESYISLNHADPSDHLAYARWLNANLAQKPRHHHVHHRRRFNIFYLHAMSMEEPGKGLSFTNVLLLLSQYKIVDPDKCLSIQDLLQFKQTRSTIYKNYFKQKALGMCRTWIARRKFLRKLQMKHSSPPVIFVDESSKAGLQIPSPRSTNHACDHSSGSYSLPHHSPTTSTSSSSWFVSPLPTILSSSPFSDSPDIDENTAQHILAALAQSPWAICLDNAVKNNEDI
ncbi:hypothetical protein DSO57_1002010 [Entomophthora muscae]|uniref:Uncharacterized protein n=1 Tax=Entomophthora muscae TaxID=34485 RepID=A0ACC2RNT7_9FUNG|nr:hypothetical protein DSO57_1002010 [Entomophthora muscae]